MDAIILAAGKGTRLLPLTKNTPQCLLPIGGIPMLQHQAKALKKAGIKDISVICGYLADKVESYAKSLGINSLLHPFFDVSGNALTLWSAREEIKKGCIFLYSDIVFEDTIIRDLLKKNGDIILLIAKDGLRDESEKVVEKDGKIISIGKDSRKGQNGEFTGIVSLSKRGASQLIESIEALAKATLDVSMIGVFSAMLSKGIEIKACDVAKAHYVDVDFPQDIEKAEKMLRGLKRG
ncbi:phosphocholine cytidylyltransferase family protein [Candidatus Woesearchaeota archaeon]|nr:phosphocholine cytidylyltransferase family protein [Candidatus Woesearchaeota archaeon]